jgi:hypothetical protein
MFRLYGPRCKVCCSDQDGKKGQGDQNVKLMYEYTVRVSRDAERDNVEYRKRRNNQNGGKTHDHETWNEFKSDMIRKGGRRKIFSKNSIERAR